LTSLLIAVLKADIAAAPRAKPKNKRPPGRARLGPADDKRF